MTATFLPFMPAPYIHTSIHPYISILSIVLYLRWEQGSQMGAEMPYYLFVVGIHLFFGGGRGTILVDISCYVFTALLSWSANTIWFSNKSCTVLLFFVLLGRHLLKYAYTHEWWLVMFRLGTQAAANLKQQRLTSNAKFLGHSDFFLEFALSDFTCQLRELVCIILF